MERGVIRKWCKKTGRGLGSFPPLLVDDGTIVCFYEILCVKWSGHVVRVGMAVFLC